MTMIHPADEREARIVWSLIAEPQDTNVSKFVATMGGWVESINALIDKPATLDLPADSRWLMHLSSSRFLATVDMLTRLGISTVIPGDPEWPTDRFEEAVDGGSAPYILYTRGDKSLLTSGQTVAIVGARAATKYGEHVTLELAAGVVGHGFTVVSGAAYGIDGMAHRAALASAGKTIAVLAGGVDRYYPAGHDQLLSIIAVQGLIVSELPPGTPPTRWRFLMRNRIIALLSDGLVVVEAGWRSGSLNAVGHASNYNRPIGAVPGPVTSAASAGCHRVIADGTARLVTNASDMVELIGAYPYGFESAE